MYDPLPPNVTIKNSPIHGLGLFCIQPIKAGEELGLSHFFWGTTLHRTPLGGFYNHSDTPNVEKRSTDSRFFLCAIKDISPGEEITCHYTFYEV